MRRFSVFLGMIGLALGMGSLAFAQPAAKPHMELVRGLRANGMADLALEYLNELKNSNPSPDIVVVLPLEYARTWLDLAAQETDEAKRKDLIAKAEERLHAFINSSKDHPLLPQANVELARLMSLKGKVIFLKARKLDKEPKEPRNKEMARARKTLEEAAGNYAKTVGILEGQLNKIDKDPSPATVQRGKELKQFLMKSMLDQGIVLFDMGETYEEEGTAAELEQRGVQFAAAKKVFEKLMYMDEKEPLCWQGRAWAAQCDFMAGDEENAKRAFAELLTKKNTNPAAAAGVRIARYFGIFRAFDKDARTPRQRWERAEKEAADWLREYPSFRNSLEGMGARYHLAFVKYTIAKEDLVYDKNTKRVTGFKNAEAKNRLDDAQKLFRELSETESEYTEKASTMRSRILIAMADADGHGDEPAVEKLGSFEVCYLMAQVQIARLGQFRRAAETPPTQPKTTDPKKDPKNEPAPKKEEPKKDEPKKDEPKKGKEPAKAAEPVHSSKAYAKEELRRFTKAMHYLEYGLQKVTPRDSVRDVFNAQLFLVQIYRGLKMYPQAAVLGEYTARSNLKMPRAALAAKEAMQAYNFAHVKPAEKDKEPAPMPAADIEHVRMAAEFLVNTWPAEAAADEARHIIGFFLLRESREKDADAAKIHERQINAWNAYAGIRDSYPAVYAARNEMAGLMYSLVRPNDGSDAKVLNQRIADNLKKYGDGTDPKFGKMWPRTLQLLEELPLPDEECLLIDAVAYLNGRSTLALLYQIDGKFDKAAAAGEQLRKALPKFAALKVDGDDLSDKQKEENKERVENFSNTAKNIILAAAHSKAYKQFTDEKNYAAVAETLNPRIVEIKNDLAKAAPAEITPAYKRLRDTQRAILILALKTAVQDQKVDRAAELVEMLDKSGNSVEENQAMLRSLVANVRRQIDDLQAERKIDDANKLKEGFTTLLDKIKAKGDKLPTSMKIFIAQGYTGVDAFDKASELLEEIRKAPPPVEPAPLAASATDKEQEAFDKAKAAFDNHPRVMRGVQLALARNYKQGKNYPAALKLYDEMIGIITKKEPVPKMDKRGWAFGAIEVRKEKAAMLEEIAAAPASTAKGAPTKIQLWANAFTEWNAMFNAFTPSLPPIPKDVDPKRERLDAKGVEEVIKKVQSDEDKDRAEAIAKFSDMVKAIPNLNVKADAKADSFLTLVKKMQSENDMEAADAQKRLLALLKGFSNSDVTDLADTCLRAEARSIKNEAIKARFEAAVKELKTEVDKNRVARSQEATTAANKRRLYFELYFEQKRCSTLAFSDLGLAAIPKGVQADLDAKFRKLAQEMIDIRTAVQKERVRVAKDKDDPKSREVDSLEKRIDEFLNENKNLKAAVKSIKAGG